MSGFALIYKAERTPALVDGSQLRPDTLCAMSADALAAMPLRIGRITLPLGDIFKIVPATDVNSLTLHNTPPLDRLGANMSSGQLIIDGDAGDDLGASMTGGLIRVHGNAGHRVGGPDVTSKRGMTGGEILISGDAADHAGFLMRRGLIAIAGRAGKSPGYRMLAGTIVVRRGPLDDPGLEMQRGTILCLCDDAQPPSSTTPRISATAGGSPAIIAASAMPALLLITRRLDQLNIFNEDPITPRIAAGSWRITHMDPFALNKGEVLQWQA